MKKIYYFAALLLVALISWPVNKVFAQAPVTETTPGIESICQILVTPSPATWLIVGFDPFSDEFAESTFSVTYANPGPDNCRFVPSFELTLPPVGLSQKTGPRINYSILNLAETKEVTPRALRSTGQKVAREIVLGPRDTKSMLYRLVVDAAEITKAGTFTQSLVIEAQDRNLRALGASPLVVGINVLPSARIGLAGAYTFEDGQALVDLGELQAGPVPIPLNLRVKSTGQYTINVTSANDGVLILGNSNWTIPYQLIIDGNTLTMRGTERVLLQRGDGIRVDNLSMQFLIGDVTKRRAGRYTDTISISISAM